jgi:putative methanogenesis marker protein 2
MLDKLIAELRSYPGITRKHIIADVTTYFQGLIDFSTDDAQGHKVLASLGEDAAVIEHGEDEVLLLAADGIMKSLMDADLRWAGYCVVLVNLNDIAAMGGIPLAMVDVLSLQSSKVYDEIMLGIKDAIKKFKVPMVGGHSHPDCDYNAVDVAILGTARRAEVIYSHTAKIGDEIVIAMDLDGRLHPNSRFSWDTTTLKSSSVVREQLLVMNQLGKNDLVTAGKDISNPGTLGTLGMLLESSNKGAVIDLNCIPIPGLEIEFGHWLKVYQGCGFVVTCRPGMSDDAISCFENVGLTAKVAGSIQASHKLEISDGKETKVLFDFEDDIITGIKPKL